jgi:type IV secretion system protein TrbJ
MISVRGRFVVAILAGAISMSPLSSHAQWIVFDPTNYVQNLLSAVRALQQINNQIQSLQNEATMLMNDAKNLAKLPTSVLSQLQATLSTTDQLLVNARGITLDVQRTQNEFSRLYPQQYGALISNSGMVNDARDRWTAALEALRTAILVQTQATQNLRDDERVLAQLVSRSQGADGALQATQATNQLLALQARQLMQDQHLRITQERAMAADHARAIAEEARAREVRRRFVGTATRYTPYPVGGY